jgi:hypothetical protein
MLIAQHQLDLVRGQVQESEQAVVVADRDGRIFMTSQAFEALLPRLHPPLDRLADLPPLFDAPTEILHRLRELVLRRQTWRGEANLFSAQGGTRPVLVRADPVFSAPGDVLGFVVVVSDMLERKVADAARRRFQERIVEGTRFAPGILESKTDLLYQNLLSSIVENAQLAALEITDGVEVRRMPELLDSVQSSVDRSAELLRRLVRHAESILPPPPNQGGSRRRKSSRHH